MHNLYSTTRIPFDTVIGRLCYVMSLTGETVDTGHWQSLTDVPQTKTIEIRSVNLEYEMPATKEELHAHVKPSEPWAELQFLERIGIYVGGRGVSSAATNSKYRKVPSDNSAADKGRNNPS